MKYLGLLLLLLQTVCYAKLNQTYPTSATTVLRMETYTDSIGTVYSSSWTVNSTAWTYFGSTATWISGNQHVYGSIFKVNGSTWNIISSSWTLENYTNMLLDEAKQRWIGEVLDKDIEQYLVFPSSTCPPGWQGWGLQTINNKPVAVPCP